MFIADLHIHSKYSRATSAECVPQMLDLWARRKGLHLIGTGDFTHQKWREELREKLIPAGDGLYALKEEFQIKEMIPGQQLAPRFVVTGEISSIYKKNGKVRKVHNVIVLPSLEHGEALARRLEAIGNLHSDGRPILGLNSRDLLEITLEACPEAIFIPAHIWTPHFSLFGAYSGFDRIEECFEDLTGHIHALETGLSSDPPMNWRLSMLDRFTLVSNSDAHSPGNLAREANLFDTELSYPHIADALAGRDKRGFAGTIEFFPEEGKYHWDGHRNCKVCQRPADTRATGGICPVCGSKVTVGVLSRVEELADREEGFTPPLAKRFESLVPLHEVIAASAGVSSASGKVRKIYDELIHTLGPELFILREAALPDVERRAGALVAEGIRRLRAGLVEVSPGYDGEYGKVKLFEKGEADLLGGQLSFVSLEEVPESSPEDSPEPPSPLPEEPVQEETPEASAPGLPYGLNTEQWEAVCAWENAVAVIAGPGTGKTKTLVSRALHLMESGGVSPSHITAVTFTNKAAGEMRARLEKQLANKRSARKITIGTFHAICLRLLSGKSGPGSLPVMDEAATLSIVEEILKGLHLKNGPRDVLRGISLQKNGAPEDSDAAVPNGVYQLYCERLEQMGALDYDDILLKALALYEGGEDLPACFDHLLVDEFQDINDLQYRLIRCWSRKSASLFVIGDPDQSIYGFRGADPGCFDRFFEDLPCTRRVYLTKNYRSTPEILQCARAALAHKDAQSGLVAVRESGLLTRLLSAEDELSQAQFMADELRRMVGGVDMLEAHNLGGRKTGHGRGFSDIALLYRTNRQAQVLERCLRADDIPYRVAGREDFLLSPLARRAAAFFRFLLNPRDRASLGSCLRDAGLSSKEAGQLAEEYAGTQRSLLALKDLLEKQEEPSDGLRKWMEQAVKYAPLAAKAKPAELLESWAKENGLAQGKDLELLLSTAVMYDTMEELLTALTLGQEGDVVRSGGRRYTPDAVSLMTIHGAKGLEFPVVFLCGVAEGLIPFESRKGECNVEEERRLFYVAMTRAQEELILITYGEPSAFLKDLPTECLAPGQAAPRKQAPAFHQFSFLEG
jgi:uncharacterized protein (TIGR00375 family)